MQDTNSEVEIVINGTVVFTAAISEATPIKAEVRHTQSQLIPGLTIRQKRTKPYVLYMQVRGVHLQGA